ncbi:polysaccharide deacetylase family protein [Falsiroseomonas sp.]|uniref:polysaccharide deacetylase family protein n=1 Tax=Falsiroseomonas sp. TaxID=2870721 RepID=UPI0027377077|nr:polysaccharide deacetylase family protein [Falsiroseomonas sp.]MDP3415520.1 polysaccharide deacetylase family protein [Falsiroseomonas sp.]
MSGLKDLLLRLGIAKVARPLLGGAGAILVFHRIRPHDPSLHFDANHRNSIPPEQFIALLDILAADGVEVVSLDEALLRLQGPPDRRFVCLGFDDGYRDNNETLLPIITARRIPVTIYVVPGLIDGTAPLWWYALDEVIMREATLRLPIPEETTLDAGDAAAKQRAFGQAMHFMLTAAPSATAPMVAALAGRYGVDFAALASRHMMDWPMLRQLAGCPLVEIGAHTMTHPALAALDAAAAAAEMSESRARLERETGRRVHHFAYPYGTKRTVGAREIRMAAELGFRTAVTTAPGNLMRRGSSPHDWPRHGIGPGDGAAALRLKLAGIRNPLHAFGR